MDLRPPPTGTVHAPAEDAAGQRDEGPGGLEPIDEHSRGVHSLTDNPKLIGGV
ncbi:hypothetical protein [Actinopolymorpha pittospori]